MSLSKNLVAEPDIVTFRHENGAFSLYYDTSSGERNPLDAVCSFDEDMPKDESITCELPNIENLTKDEQKSIVCFDGDIGNGTGK